MENINLKFGKLEVLSLGTPRGLRKAKHYVCRCECGTVKEINTYHLIKGSIISCGCHKLKVLIERSTTHGMSGTPEHRAWKAIKKRCYSTNNPDYKYYGAMGVTVHEGWLNDFAAFYAHVGKRPGLDYSIDRWPNNNGNYEPGNVRWATVRQQNNNQRDNIRIEVSGETHTSTEWAGITGLTVPNTVSRRIKDGWDPQEAATTPRVDPALSQFKESRFITVDGVTHSIAEWVRKLGISRNTVKYRLRHGWSERDAIATPVGAPRSAPSYAAAPVQTKGVGK